MENWMWAIWLGLFVLAVILEAVTAEFVSVWFAGGAIIAMILSFIPGVAWWIPIIVFFVISITLLFCLRPLVRKLLKRNVVSSNADSLIHSRGILLDRVTPFERGSVKINDVTWTAIAADEREEIPAQSIVEVVAIDGNKLIVRKVSEPEANTLKEENK